LALSWALNNCNVSTVILGASKLAQLEENLKASELKTRLNPEFMEKIDVILGNKPEHPNF